MLIYRITKELGVPNVDRLRAMFILHITFHDLLCLTAETVVKNKFISMPDNVDNIFYDFIIK